MHVSIAGGAPKVFGTFTSQLHALRDWLLQEEVCTVAMEATGVYWIALYEILEESGIEIKVVNGKYVRNVPGRKTDMADCQWIATLHAHGLLKGGFVPQANIRQLQDYLRLRSDHIRAAASHVQHMQKALERMNIKFHDVIRSLSGVSGLKVIEAILKGERDPQVLLSLCSLQIQRAKRHRVIESLRGTWTKQHLFALRQAYDAWHFCQELVRQCDQAIEELLQESVQGLQPPSTPSATKRIGGCNAPLIKDLHRLLMTLCKGKDPTLLPGITDYGLLELIGEVGTDLTCWKSEKHFTAWLGLAPGSKQSGKRQARCSRSRNRAGRIFCVVARSLARSVNKALGGFYRRLRARRGGLVANKALARKLAALFWRVMVHGFPYVERGLEVYHEQVALSQKRLLSKLAAKHGYSLVPNI